MTEVLVQNTCSFDRIDPRLTPIVDATVAGMVECCGGSLKELRLQGSIARGDAIIGQADLDMIALLDGSPSACVHACLRDLAARLGARTKLVSRFDLEAIDGDQLEPFRHFVLSSDSLCVHGVDSLTLGVQSRNRLTLAQLVTPDPTIMVPDYLAWVDDLDASDDAERRFAGRIIGKDLLKVLRGVLLLRGATYEVASADIAAQIPEVAPEATGVAERLLALYNEPTTDIESIRTAVVSVATYLQRCPETALLTSMHHPVPKLPTAAAS